MLRGRGKGARKNEDGRQASKSRHGLEKLKRKSIETANEGGPSKKNKPCYSPRHQGKGVLAPRRVGEAIPAAIASCHSLQSGVVRPVHLTTRTCSPSTARSAGPLGRARRATACCAASLRTSSPAQELELSGPRTATTRKALIRTCRIWSSTGRSTIQRPTTRAAGLLPGGRSPTRTPGHHPATRRLSFRSRCPPTSPRARRRRRRRQRRRRRR